MPERGYHHREHRSRKSKKGQNTKRKREDRLKKLMAKELRDKEFLKRFRRKRAMLVNNYTNSEILTTNINQLI